MRLLENKCGLPHFLFDFYFNFWYNKRKKGRMKMIAKLIKKNEEYYCSECRMKQPTIIKPYCCFCEANFSNYEEELIKSIEEMENSMYD